MRWPLPANFFLVGVNKIKKGKVEVEGSHFQRRWKLQKLQYFFTENQNSCACLICQETVHFNLKRQTKYANAFGKLSGSDRAETVKQLKAVWASKQQLFTWALNQMKIPPTTDECHRATFWCDQAFRSQAAWFSVCFKDFCNRVLWASWSSPVRQNLP